MFDFVESILKDKFVEFFSIYLIRTIFNCKAFAKSIQVRDTFNVIMIAWHLHERLGTIHVD